MITSTVSVFLVVLTGLLLSSKISDRPCPVIQGASSKKHGADYRRQWRKVHLGIDAQTLEIRAIEITDNAIGDTLMLPKLLAQIPVDEPLHSVSADGAYDTKACHEAITSRQAAAIIPTRKNASPWDRWQGWGTGEKRDIESHTQAWPLNLEEMERLPPAQPGGTQDGMLQETGRAREMARDFDRQVTELQVRASILNRFASLGTPQTVRMA
jgi:hypothetical protein